jgi:hypothetical protein
MPLEMRNPVRGYWGLGAGREESMDLIYGRKQRDKGQERRRTVLLEDRN